MYKFDNKITKTRLYSLFIYDWIKLVAIFLGLILVWELLAGITGVHLTTGQQFTYTFDLGVYRKSEGYGEIDKLITGEDGLGYNVLNINSEEIIDKSDILNTRIAVYDVDVLFSCSEADANETNRVDSLIDGGTIYNLEKLLEDAKKYISDFQTDGIFDNEKIKSHFLYRMAKDNRFKSEEQKAEGVKLEIKRIEALAKNVADFEKILSHDELLYRYTRFEQSYNLSNEKSKAQYEEYLSKEKEAGRENVPYGIDLGKIKSVNGKIDITRIVSPKSDVSTANGVILMAFDFLKEQPDEQFEVINFITILIRNCSDILD